jgi:hypothetical protein
MNAGPPCPGCGEQLRWYQQLQQWGCERCRMMYPVVRAPLRPTAPPAPRGSGIGVWVGIVLTVLVAGGATAAVLLMKTKDPGPGAGRDAAVRETFAALTQGDLDALWKRAGSDELSHYLKCDTGAKPSDPQGARDDKDLRDELARAIARERGVMFEVTGITETGNKTIAKGAELRPGCTLSTPMVIHDLDVGLQITRAGKKRDGKAELKATELDGKWLVTSAPNIQGCSLAIARVSLAGGDVDQQAAMIDRCEADGWSAEVIGCATKALAVTDVGTCLAHLTPEQQGALRRVVGGKSGMLPDSEATADVGSGANATASADPSTVTLGSPEEMPIADFWVYPRSDGAYLARSTLVDVVFAHKPVAKVEPSPNKTADGRSFDMFTLSDDLGGRGLVQLQLMSLGRGARDVKGVDAVRQLLAKYGPVHESHRTEGAADISRLEVADGDKQLTVDSRLDLRRGLIVIATAATTPADRAIADRFLSSIQMRDAPDPVADPKTLTGVRIRKAGAKLVVHDANDSLTFELPWPGKVDRKPGAAPSRPPQVTITAEKKRSKIVVQITEVAAWDGLVLESPTRRNEALAKDQASTEVMIGSKLKRSAATIAGMPAVIIDPSARTKPTIQLRSIYNRYQHRKLDIVCVDAPCDTIASSLHFADPKPPQ